MASSVIWLSVPCEKLHDRDDRYPTGNELGTQDCRTHASSWGVVVAVSKKLQAPKVPLN